MKQVVTSALLVTLALLAVIGAAVSQIKPALSDYYTVIASHVLDASYSPHFASAPFSADVNGDDNIDMIILGIDLPLNGVTSPVPQPGRLFYGDGNGNFSPDPASNFPAEILAMVNSRNVLFADFNGDGRTDIFVNCHGWDTAPYPGEQNRLYLSQPGGSWIDATSTLPQLSDYSHSAAV